MILYYISEFQDLEDDIDDLSPDHIRHRIIAPSPPPLSLSPMSPGDGNGFFSQSQDLGSSLIAHDPDNSLNSLMPEFSSISCTWHSGCWIC